MKKISIILMAIAFLFLASCTGREKEISQKTLSFLDAYFKTDFSLAGTFCTNAMALELKDKFKSIDSLDPVIKEMLKNHSRLIQTQILAVERFKRGDSAKVSYRVIMPEGKQYFDKSISLVMEDKEWRISKLGK